MEMGDAIKKNPNVPHGLAAPISPRARRRPILHSASPQSTVSIMQAGALRGIGANGGCRRL